MNSKALLIGLVLLAQSGLADVVGGTDTRAEGVKDAYDQVRGVVAGLAQLADRPKVQEIKVHVPSRALNRGAGRPAPKGAAAPAPSAPAVARELHFQRKTVYTNFDIKIFEKSDSFIVYVKSDPLAAQEVVVKDGKSQAVLAKQSLNDQTDFQVKVPYPLNANVGLSIALNDAQNSGGQNIVRAYVKVFE